MTSFSIGVVLGVWSWYCFKPKSKPKDNGFDQLSYLALIWLYDNTENYDQVAWQGFGARVRQEIQAAILRKEEKHERYRSQSEEN